MKLTKVLTALLLGSLLASTAYADTCGKKLTGPFPAAQAAKLCATFIGTATLSASLIPGADNTYDLGNATYQVRNIYIGTKAIFGGAGPIVAPTQLAIAPGSATTPVYTFTNNTATFASADLAFTGAGFQPKYPASVVVTPGVTYGAGLGTLSSRFSFVATAGPTSQFYELAAPTSNVGKSFDLINSSANPAPIVPAAGAINLTGALTPYACATQKRCTCTGIGTAQYWCASQ